MNDKLQPLKNENISNDITPLVEKKIAFFKDVIQKTIIHVQRNKFLDILGIGDVGTCIDRLGDLNKKIHDVANNKNNPDSLIASLQTINNDLSGLLKNYGTDSLEDLLLICFGNNTKLTCSNEEQDKLDLLKKYFHPSSYKVVTRQEDAKQKKNEDYTDDVRNLTCFDTGSSYKQFNMKVYGIKLLIRNVALKKSLLIYGVVDDVVIDFLDSKYITDKRLKLTVNMPSDSFQKDSFDKFISSLILKDYLVYENDGDLYARYAGYISQNNVLRQKPVSQLVKEFITDEMYNKRSTLINLLLCSSNYENQYLAYLLYDILSNDTNGTVDTQEQTILFDSFPWSIKQCFKQAMKKTIQYTNELSNFDINKIPLEQQICLLKASDTVKEKAMMKLKEVKAKSEDSGSKARQYLDALLKVPFNVYKREPILNVMNKTKSQFKDTCDKYDICSVFPEIPKKEKYTSIEVLKHIKKIRGETGTSDKNEQIEKMRAYLTTGDKKKLLANANALHIILKKHSKKTGKVSTLTKEDLISYISNILNTYNGSPDQGAKNILEDICAEFVGPANMNPVFSNVEVKQDIQKIDDNMKQITDYMDEVKSTLDKAVHGHDKAKKQIERIIGQWLNGEQDGYCFGFEGPPGVGKCFARNTPIMLSNGEIKMVQDITLCDKLMGDDSKERNVLALGNGNEKMYRIEQVTGDDYIVNESHILSLKMTKCGKKDDNHQVIVGKRYVKDDIVDICIKDYLALPKYIKECLKGYKVGVEFSERHVDVDPYALGCWLGGGSDADNNTLINKLNEYNLINNKHIPNSYKCNSRKIRLQLLAGIIDTDGYYNKHNNSFEITQKNKNLTDDILWVVCSLGFRGTTKECAKSSTYRTIITGQGLQDIPTLLERNKPRQDKQSKDCLNTRINVIPLEEDEYFGFQIDGNSRFLLGDFTVTHNTSLAKRGLSDCLKDENGNSRPFSMIQMGGDSNGSTLHGHNYTYVGSTWGSIVQSLIDKKCMNPIIFIDEVDKISRTEHGKEIVGILTHLLDPAQNDCFQDKYFTGIDLDLSKALFILSYNDVDAIDKILLDRVHRIKFNSLTLEDKLVISKTHILPEVYKKMGLEDTIVFADDVLKFIIEEYTLESGVRKLKEIMFEIVGEINLDILKNNNKHFDLPIHITIENIKTKYFKDKREVIIRKVPEKSLVGFANGMFATSLGNGGTLPIHAKFFPCEQFLELKLTGLQQDVMRESMHVSLTVAWNLTSDAQKKHLRTSYDGENNKYGINIHPGDGSVQKDGPSAGGIITIVLYSLLNNIPIKAKMAMTGEIQMSGDITAIGGLNYKILGSIKAGIKEFIYPKENKKDFLEFYEKYKNDSVLEGIKFHEVDHISEALDLILDKDSK